MRSFIIGLFTIMILIFFGIAISTSEGRTLRENELDNSLGKAIEQTMTVAKTKPTYDISTDREMVADMIQNLLVQMDSESSYEVTVYTADLEKGIMDVGVTQKYNQLFGLGKVTARKMIVLDTYENVSEEYCTITFMNGDEVLKQLSIFKGNKIPSALIPSDPTFYGWCDSSGNVFTNAQLANIAILNDDVYNVVLN